MNSKEYLENIKDLVKMINNELDRMREHNEIIKAKYLDNDYYFEGVARGLKDARNVVNIIIENYMFDKILSIQEEVKGEE